MTARVSKPVRIEQALAFGRSWQWIHKNIGATDSDICKAILRMDKANAETDVEMPTRHSRPPERSMPQVIAEVFHALNEGAA